MTSLFISLIRRDLAIAFRRKADVLNPLIFYLLVITLFPLGLGPEPQLMARLAPGIIWVSVLLSALLSFERLFKDDLADGSLQQMMLMSLPLPLVALAKVIAHWLLTALPLVLLSPLAALLLNLDGAGWLALVLTLLAGSPALSLVGAVGVALTVGLKRGGILLSLLVLPLYIPVLIFATGSLEAAALGLSYSGQLALLAAFSLGALTLCPFAIASALKISING
ncbi:heme exporter protein CcmB [Gallaecimonas pentaromativorans]|uniref:Heme exporter protein B n=1 Tax=Gallaecimonas pentaromativorans TaxID=584787 RepID=A0A3N1P5Z6_9GAMM|nr:heme exporter protein CcmB [Gallaecimonas pentaromativorans]MED5526658.1 heme exporter protein CcmB [Pseudomonadota bacterium]ROQ22557.1 heme exporter protein B [Gallaecimonas pentaromativorans]